MAVAKWLLSSVQNSHWRLNLPILRSHSLELVTIVLVINVVIGGFSGEDLNWLAHVTVRFHSLITTFAD